MRTSKIVLIISCVIFLSVFLNGCSSNEVTAIDEIHENFQDSYRQAKMHSTTLTLLKNRIQCTTRAMGKMSIDTIRKEAYAIIKDEYFKQEKEAVLRTDEAYKYIVLENPVAISDIYSNFGTSFFDEVIALIEKGGNESYLMNKMELLLSHYKSDKNYEAYVGLAAVALDSYVFWVDNIDTDTETRGLLSSITSVIEADVLSAASFLLYSGAVAFYGAVASGGATVLPTVCAVAARAAFGSAVRGICYLW